MDNWNAYSIIRIVCIFVGISYLVGCNPTTEIIKHERTEYRDSVTHYILERDTITVTDTIVKGATIAPVKAKTEFTEGVAWVEDYKLNLQLYNTVDSLPIKFRYEIRYITNKEIIEVDKLPKWAPWLLIGLGASVLLLIIALILRR